ncbi:MAG: methionyl-tRNA formyltransferase [Holosporaceae bacterium]|jgi:methionyl-tRNA formyltransferase|nr:methionyl-tRNA formyltransferase [Holosporaceae bacterium]
MTYNNRPPRRIVFMGSSDFSLASMAALQKGAFDIIGVYTQPPKPSGRSYKVRKSPVQLFAEAQHLPVYTPTTLRNDEQRQLLEKLHPDLVVVSSYGLIIPKNLLDIPTHGFINVHASLLPRWRGAAPIQMALLAGDTRTGITMMKMDPGLDTGDIIAVESLEITTGINAGTLSQKLAHLGADLLLKTLENLEENLASAVPQQEIGVTYAAKISPDSGRINWDKSACDILKHILAFAPTPAAWGKINGLRLKIFDAEIGAGQTVDANQPGRLYIIEGDLWISCGDGHLMLREVQLEGKRRMSGREFCRGRPTIDGETLT